MDEQKKKARSGDHTYTLNTDEFLEIMGAIKELPRIYKHIEKIDTHIEKLAETQQRDIFQLRTELDETEKTADRALELAQDAKRRLDNLDTNAGHGFPNASSNEAVSAKDLFNLIIKLITFGGAVGSIIYLLVEKLVQ